MQLEFKAEVDNKKEHSLGKGLCSGLLRNSQMADRLLLEKPLQAFKRQERWRGVSSYFQLGLPADPFICWRT
jgi:hypothetical protein